LARAIAVPPRRINEIVKGLRGITVDTALRLAAFFGTDAQSWINLQPHYDVEFTRQTMAKVLSRIQPYRSQQRRLAALERMASNARELGLEY
jgi:plasmid maintenance system antidote protein VapI